MTSSQIKERKVLFILAKFNLLAMSKTVGFHFQGSLNHEKTVFLIEEYTYIIKILIPILEYSDDQYSDELLDFKKTITNRIISLLKDGKKEFASITIEAIMFILNEKKERVLEGAIFENKRDEQFIYKRVKNLQTGFVPDMKFRLKKAGFSNAELPIFSKGFSSNIQDEIKNVVNQSLKLRWKGTPAHLALLIDVLIEKGYLETSGLGERTAEILLSIFEFDKHKPSKESLGKLLHKDKYPINDKTVVDRFNKIPHRSELKK